MLARLGVALLLLPGPALAQVGSPGAGSVTVSGTVTVDSEMPAAAALGDATANPTSPLMGCAVEGWNGTTWDRLTSTTANGLDVDVTRLPALVAGTANIGDVDVLTMPADATELPAAAALGDDTATPTTPLVGCAMEVWDGATWDRLPGTSADGVTSNTELTTSDLDPGVGTDTRAVVGIALATSAGATLVGAGADGEPVPISDDGGSITIDGTVTANAGSGSFTVNSELESAGGLGDGGSAAPTTSKIGAIPLLMNATTTDRQRAILPSTDSTGTGIAAAGMVGLLDDTSPVAVTENQFGPVRISSRKAVLVETYTGADPCATTIAKSSAVISATADAELVALSGSTVIYVCGFSFGLSGTTTPTARLIYGTGTVCATGLTALTGAYANGGTPTVPIHYEVGNGGGTVMKGAAGNALCIDVEGTSPSAVGVVSFVQQ